MHSSRSTLETPRRIVPRSLPHARPTRLRAPQYRCSGLYELVCWFLDSRRSVEYIIVGSMQDAEVMLLLCQFDTVQTAVWSKRVGEEGQPLGNDVA